MTLMPSLEHTMALLRPSYATQYGKNREALIESMAVVLAYHFEAERMALVEGKEYEHQIMVSDLDDMWESFADDLVQMCRRVPVEVWN